MNEQTFQEIEIRSIFFNKILLRDAAERLLAGIVVFFFLAASTPRISLPSPRAPGPADESASVRPTCPGSGELFADNPGSPGDAKLNTEQTWHVPSQWNTFSDLPGKKKSIKNQLFAHRKFKEKKIQIVILQWKRISLKYTEQHFITAWSPCAEKAEAGSPAAEAAPSVPVPACASQLTHPYAAWNVPGATAPLESQGVLELATAGLAELLWHFGRATLWAGGSIPPVHLCFHPPAACSKHNMSLTEIKPDSHIKRRLLLFTPLVSWKKTGSWACR